MSYMTFDNKYIIQGLILNQTRLNLRKIFIQNTVSIFLLWIDIKYFTYVNEHLRITVLSSFILYRAKLKKNVLLTSALIIFKKMNDKKIGSYYFSIILPIVAITIQACMMGRNLTDFSGKLSDTR